jgi:ABC-type transport system substrate-binding protein
VKWHNKPPANGRDLKVDDVVYSLERARNPAPQFAVRSLLDAVDKIEIADAQRIRFTLKVVDTGMIDKLTAFSLAVLAPEVVERAGDKFATPDVVVGTGPYLLTAMTDVSATHSRNPTYWKAGLPYLDEVLTLSFADEEAKWAAFQADRLDYIDQVPGPSAKKYATNQGQFTIDERYRAEWAATPALLMLMVNVTRQPFSDPRVYKALRLMIDYQEVLKTEEEIASGRSGVSQAFPAALSAWDFTTEEYTSRFLPWRPSKDEAAKTARELLAAAGFTPEKPLTLGLATSTDPSYQVRGQLLQAQWRRLSQGAVQAELKLFQPSQILGVGARRDFDAWLHGAAPPVGEPDANLRTFYHSKGSRNYSGWNDSRADDLIDRQRAALQVEQRKTIIKDLLRYMVDEAPAVVWNTSYSLTATQPRVRDWAPETDAWASAFQFEHIWLDV